MYKSVAGVIAFGIMKFFNHMQDMRKHIPSPVPCSYHATRQHKVTSPFHLPMAILFFTFSNFIESQRKKSFPMRISQQSKSRKRCFMISVLSTWSNSQITPHATQITFINPAHKTKQKERNPVINLHQTRGQKLKKNIESNK